VKANSIGDNTFVLSIIIVSDRRSDCKVEKKVNVRFKVPPRIT